MLKALKEFFDGRIQHHDIVLFSSFFYLFCAMVVGKKDPLITTFLFLVFLTSLFYHSYPKNICFRLADWIASLTFIFYIFNFIIRNNLIHSTFLMNIFAILAITSILSWLISFLAFIYNHNKVYNLTHTLWHLLGAIVIGFIVLSI